MGFVIMLTGAIYLLIAIGVVAWVVKYAKENGNNSKKWGWVAAHIMYLIPFWDWIPTVVAHKYYCSAEAGFWVYKTPGQWKLENPGVMEGLTTSKVWQHDYSGGGDVVHINQRINLTYEKEGELFLHRWKWQRKLVDVKTKEVLAQYVDFSTGNGNIGGEMDLKFWIHNDFCSGGESRAIKFGEFYLQFKGVEK